MALRRKYIALIEAFLRRDIDAKDFRIRCIQMHYSDLDAIPERRTISDESAILDQLVIDADAFCGDPELFNENDITEDELRQSCEKALTRLKALPE